MIKKGVSILAVGMVLLLSNISHAGVDSALMMATTTSTDNTGLLDYLAPKYKEATGIELRWTAVGTGKALKLGENCDCDVLLVHSPSDEMKFVNAGFGVDRCEIMYNDFVIIGPDSDPAGIRGKSIADAFKLVTEKQAIFVSRADNSGTHEKEQLVWRAAGLQIPDREKWYIQTGQGMMSTIMITAERNGYTLTDRGTYIKYEDNFKGNPRLKILVEGDKALLNQYSVIAVNPKHCPNVKYDLALQFIKWMSGTDGQRLISEFRIAGKTLFTPNAKQ